jgi:hypothetical protein
VGGTWAHDGQSSYSRFSVVPNLKTDLAYFILPQIALEAAIIGRFNPNVSVFSPLGQLSSTLGFQIHLGTKRKPAEIKK